VDATATATASAAYQVTIWTVEYGAGFAYDSLGAVFANQVSSYIGTASVEALPPGSSLSFLEPLNPSVSQTLVFDTPGGAVPEASTWAMMLPALAASGSQPSVVRASSSSPRSPDGTTIVWSKAWRSALWRPLFVVHKILPAA
jgi:hypothetical protein